ncbi:glycosyltransferase [Haloplasma contractile]|uniref:Group 1 glycosyl transferase protein n=1 Tax=Haloplasma contractile SSD-17B TaxID=1033810 RepID=U2E6U4_9MOLU|nr:glycosyltransferase [Haloplasma contractile]ERJ10938.1 group 1 glycosyl transferase protein [Haloplasma contractile SSD-17B]
MKIVHVALCGPVTDYWTYQDNLLPKYHKINNHEVVMITSKYIYNSNGNLILDDRDSYINENEIKTIRIKIKNDKPFHYRFKKYINLYNTLEKESPEIIFIHGVQFLDIYTIIKYLKKHPDVKVFVDNHADFSNSATNFFSRNFLHKILWRFTAKMIEPYTNVFYGVLPARADFLHDVYKIPTKKIKLLVMGADDEKVLEATSESVKKSIRKKFKIEPTDFLIVTGGKIDQAKKQTILLMKAVKELGIENVKLIVFGSIISKLEDEVNNIVDGKKIQYVGWVEPEESYKYFGSADLVVFPGRHSVFWEQVVALGIPLIVKHWEGTDHINLGENCRFLYEDSISEIKNIVEELIIDKDKYNKMKLFAENHAAHNFLYSKIAKKSIELN